MNNELEKHLESLDPDTRRQLDNDFRGVIKAVEEYKGVGSLTLKITVKPNGNKCIVATQVTTKHPRPSSEAAVRWYAKDGGLADEDPRQQKLPLRTIPASITKIKEEN